MSSEILTFYKELKQSGRLIILNRGKSDGYTGYASVTNSDNFICINKLETFADLQVLVHEIGHAYYNYCNHLTLEDNNNLSLKIKSEVPAMWLEMLFNVYLRSYKNQKIKKNKVHNFNDLMIMYGLYATSFLQMGNQDRKIEDMYKFIYETDYRQLINPLLDIKSLRK